MKSPDELKKNIFETPDGYFEALPGRIQERIQQEKQEKKSFTLPQWTYAAAASVLLLLTGGIFFFQLTDQPTETIAAEQNVEQLLASISEDEIIDYLQMNAEVSTLELTLTEEEQQELLLNELDNYNIPLEDYAYEVEYIEEYF
ncbi:hypothetical protein WJR50_03120 [Catalinimonas sp. 4WD22]|uniref:hypothetical protein n=1 Tax=Catalinimonas locisalis TaxID=3133978 RepID=UPI00310120B1